MKTKTSSIIAATVAAALASVASAQITPGPTGVNTFTAPVYAANGGPGGTYAAALGGLYFDSNANVPSAQVNLWTPGLPAPTFLAGGGTVKTIFIGESAGSLNDFGYTTSPYPTPIENAVYTPLGTDIDNNNGFIASGWEAYANYGAGQTITFWLNNPGTFNPGGAYFSFLIGASTTSAFAAGDTFSHVKYNWQNVMTTYQDGMGNVVTGNVNTLLVAFEDLRPAAGGGNEAPTQVDGDFTDFIVAFQFLPTQVPVPEPSTYGLMGAGALLGLVGYRRFKASKKAA